MGEAEPTSPRARLWLLVQVVCRYQRAVDRAARADLAEHDAFVLAAENKALKARADHLERHSFALANRVGHLEHAAGHALGNVVWMTARFRVPEVCGPRQQWRVILEPQ